MSKLFWLSAALMIANPAVAQDAIYVFELASRNPSVMQAWHRIMPERFESSWAYNFEGPSIPMQAVSLSGKTYFVGWMCKPHDCPNYEIAFLIAADGSQAFARVGIWAGEEGNEFGSPTAEEAELMASVLDEKHLPLSSRSRR